MTRKWRADWEVRPDHSLNPVWYDRRDNIICKDCRKQVVGDGTVRNPWRHEGEPVAPGFEGATSRPLNCCGSTEGHLATCETVVPA